MIDKECLYHVLRVKDLQSEAPPLETVPVVKDFAEVIPDDLPRVPPEREIDFSINLLKYTKPLSIPP